ncbi:hypothetical protein NPIL_197031 [Nephila pilipes]|uniref:Uncharacterized protein n=1 Tax=Nephila pilipes TaxID=299642 RepID=A0A8X6U3B7_NEPPI|nr:hypothetical protein NPIL_197031 [Nephila pilipes]
MSFHANLYQSPDGAEGVSCISSSSSVIVHNRTSETEFACEWEKTECRVLNSKRDSYFHERYCFEVSCVLTICERQYFVLPISQRMAAVPRRISGLHQIEISWIDLFFPRHEIPRSPFLFERHQIRCGK